MTTTVVGILCVLSLLAFGCNSKSGGDKVIHEDPNAINDEPVKSFNLDTVISEDDLVEPLLLNKIKEIDLKSYSTKIKHAIIQNAMNGVVLLNCDQRNPDYMHPSIHTLLSYSIESQTYKTIYQFSDDSFVLADIAFCGDNYYAILFDQAHQEFEDTILYQVVTFEGDSYKVIDSGKAQSPFDIPCFHVLDGKVFYVGEADGCYNLKELKDGKVHQGETVFGQQNNSNIIFDAISLQLAEDLGYAYLTHTVDEDNLYTSTALTIKDSEPIQVAIDTEIIALSGEAILISYDQGSTLDVIKISDMQELAQYNATNKKIYISSTLNGMHYATMEIINRSEYQPIVFTFNKGELKIRRLAEIEKDMFSLVTIYNINDGKWGIKVMGEKVDQFYVVEPVYR
jgi:hypothetical protein